MPVLIVVGSVKGSPGATTLALALAATWPSRADAAVVVEADCAGGDVGGRCWLPDSPGLASLATAARSGPVLPEDHATHLACGATVVVAPAERQPATVAVGLLAEAGTDRWTKDYPLIADVGRLDPGTPAAQLAASADAMLVCTLGDESSLSRLVSAGLPGDVAGLVVIGGSDYAAGEIEEATGVPVAAGVPWDPKAARTLWGRERPRSGWDLRGLPAVARGLAERLNGHRSRSAPQVSSARPRPAEPEGLDAWLKASPSKRSR